MTCFRRRSPMSVAPPLLAMIFVLDACTDSNSSNTIAATSGGASGANGWKATDACATLDKSVVAATLGAPVQSAELSAVKDQGGGFDLFSQCSYLLADGRMLVFGTGQATNSASVPEQVKSMRDQGAIVATKPIVDLPGVGKAGLWSAELGAAYAFLGDGRYVSATVSVPDFRKPQQSEEKTQNDDIAILRKVGA